MPRPSLADLLRSDPWGRPQLPQTPLAKILADPSLGFTGAVDTYLARLKRMQAGPAQDMLDTAADPNAEGIQRAANLLGGLGLKIANVPMALMPSSQELRDRGYQAGASPEVQALGGALGDAVNIPDPATVGPALATLVKAGATAKALAAGAAPLLKSAAVAPLGKGLASLMADASPAEQAALGKIATNGKTEAMNGIDAWHGSPHDFDSFDNAHIGAGEGTQIQGKGFYFGDKEHTGDWYRNRLSAPLDYPNIPNDVFGKIDEVAPRGLEQVVKRANAIFENIGIGQTHPNWEDFKDYVLRDTMNGTSIHDETKKALDILGGEGGWADEFNKRRGKLYNVTLDVKHENLADIGLPVKENDRLRKAVEADPNLRGVVSPDHSGDTFIRALESVYGPDGASKWMQNAGFDGVKYPNHEAVSRGRSSEGSYNYVIYDPKKIKIKSKH